MPNFFFVFCLQLEFVIRPIAVGDLSEAEEESHNRPILPNELGEELSDKEPWSAMGLMDVVDVLVDGDLVKHGKLILGLAWGVICLLQVYVDVYVI